jgi:hypothetical protein
MIRPEAEEATTRTTKRKWMKLNMIDVCTMCVERAYELEK